MESLNRLYAESRHMLRLCFGGACVRQDPTQGSRTIRIRGENEELCSNHIRYGVCACVSRFMFLDLQ